MANNSISGRFRKLYQEVEDNLSADSKDILNGLYKSGTKALHDFRNNLLEKLDNEYIKIINDLAYEYNITVSEIEDENLMTRWDLYMAAIERLHEQIHKEEDLVEELNEGKVEDNLQIKLINVIKDIEKELNIPGQVIDFMLYLYDMGAEFVIAFK